MLMRLSVVTWVCHVNFWDDYRRATPLSVFSVAEATSGVPDEEAAPDVTGYYTRPLFYTFDSRLKLLLVMGLEPVF